MTAAFVREPGCVCTDPSLVARAGHERRCPLYREREDAASTPGPTIHTVVMDNRTTDLFDLIDRDVKTRLEDFRLVFVAAQEEAIRQAYLRGVRDGFQQGVLAASEADRG